MTRATATKTTILTDKPPAEQRASLIQTRMLPTWQDALRDVITDPEELLTLLRLDNAWLEGAQQAAKLFPLRVPRSYVAKMQRGNPHDPLLRQILPLSQESTVTEGFSADAVGDLHSLLGSGLLQKYQGRALLITTGACAVHCRFCFRRDFPYGEQTAARNNWQESLEQIQNDPGIKEVILSGGDPLSLNDAKLSALAARLDDIPHLERLRIHTRQPIVLPERVDQKLLKWISGGRLQRIIVLHVNHPNELNTETAQGLLALSEAGATLLNQSVLLKGVNDSPDTLVQLSEALIKLNILPYYLHLLDRVQGTAHFEVPELHAIELMQELAANLPGYMVPKLVREEMGKSNKTNVLW